MVILLLRMGQRAVVRLQHSPCQPRRWTLKPRLAHPASERSKPSIRSCTPLSIYLRHRMIEIPTEAARTELLSRKTNRYRIGTAASSLRNALILCPDLGERNRG